MKIYLVFARVAPELDLGEDLVTETVGHDEAGVTHGTAQVNKSALSQQKDVLAVGECVAVNLTSVFLIFSLLPFLS